MKKLISCILLVTVAACGGDVGVADGGPVGAACVADGQCESDLCVTEFNDSVAVLDGLCTNECSFEEPESCAEGEVCLRYNPTNEHYCFQQCATDEDCREDWTCVNLFTDKACIPPL